MSRTRIISDEAILATLRGMLAGGGDKAVSFATVGQAVGLAASTLAQRFATRDGMVRAALVDGWDRLDAATTVAEGEAPVVAKSVPTLLKLIGREQDSEISVLVTNLRDAVLRERAEAWRARVEAAIALRLGGGGEKTRESAAMIFAAWQGRLLWSRPGDSAFKLKDAIKRLG